MANANSLWWAERHRKVREGNILVPFSIDVPPRLYPFLRPIYYDRRPHGPSRIVFKKPVQIGATEFAFNSALYAIDVFGVNVGYMLPGKAELNDLAGSRIDKIIRDSPHIMSLFDNIDNAGLKSGGKGSLYFRGSHSPSGLEEFSCGFLIRDELDRMDQENASLALKRLSGSTSIKWRLDLGHPILPDKGIDLAFQNSSMSEWYFKCPFCHTEQHEDFFHNVDREKGIFICAECGKELQKSDLLSGYYKAEHPDHPCHGYHISQLLSPTVSVEEIIDEWNEAQEIPYMLALFYRTVLGLAYAESGRQLTEADVRRLMKGPPMVAYGENTYVGIDVGKGLHYWIQDEEAVLNVGVVGQWSDLDLIMESFKPKSVVIDAGPEEHSAQGYMLKLREQGIEAWLCRRSGQRAGKRLADEQTHVITVNITEQLDRFFANLRKLLLPIDLPQMCIDHLCAPTRITVENTSGIAAGKYVKGISHLADAGSYCCEGLDELKPKQHIIPAVSPPVDCFVKQSSWIGRFR